MTITRWTQPAAAPDEGSDDPALTEKETGQLGYSREEHRQAVNFRVLTVEDHRRAGTARAQYYPPEHVGRAICEPFIEAATEHMETRLSAEVDPLLDDSQTQLEAVKGDLDELESRVEPLRAPESGIEYAAAEAVERVKDLDEQIDADERASKPHHRRAPYWLLFLGPWVPYTEFIGFLFFCAVWLNVPILQPWLDFGAWTLSVTLVAAIIFGQTWLVHLGAKNHNHGREAFALNNRHQGEHAYRRRDQFLIGAAATVTLAITSGMVLRGLMTLGEATMTITLYMVTIAVIAGYVMPALGYLAIATDGSRVSRERDALASQLGRVFEEQKDMVRACQGTLTAVEETRKLLVTATLPGIVDSTQAIVDEAYRMYGLTWLLIGHLQGPQPGKVPALFGFDNERPVGRIETSIPGGDIVDLKPLFDRANRALELDASRAALTAQLAALPTHPWSTDRT